MGLIGLVLIVIVLRHEFHSLVLILITWRHGYCYALPRDGTVLEEVRNVTVRNITFRNATWIDVCATLTVQVDISILCFIVSIRLVSHREV